MAFSAQENITALSRASGSGHEEVVTVLIEYKANVNTQNKVNSIELSFTLFLFVN